MKEDNEERIFKEVPNGKVGWKSPSNIALVKYWGKKPGQVPANASLSFTLRESVTETTIEFEPASGEGFKLEFFLDGMKNEKFADKTVKYFESISNSFPFIKQLDFKIRSKNSFPHSAGIASSASGMSALALCLCEIERKYFDEFSSDEKFFKRASYFARLGSGSACRSVYGGFVSWGEIEGVRNTSNMFGNKINKNIDSVFDTFQDSILIVDAGEKEVSSSLGHSLMNSNPYSLGRLKQAGENMIKLMEVIKTGDLGGFVKIVESEALSLHAMMMTSNPYFLLMKPNTISIIEKVREYRGETGIQACFTLDAGPNVHLIYPDENKKEVRDFIGSELLKLTVNETVIHDEVGQGPERIAY
ncbi:MAG: diphosphomevalonate decarboxylase [Chlorobi bacterium]|nr:diphosphomevalonate decarboxylase [Chlorobiota bacterium]